MRMEDLVVNRSGAPATAGAPFFMDEPLAGAGAEESRHITSIIENLKSQHATLLIEHDMDAVFKLADRITVLVEGKTIASGTPDEISNNSAVRNAYLGDGD